MPNRRLFLAALCMTAAIGLAGPASSADRAPFTQAAFEAAKAAGGPVLVDVTAPWCPTCKAQKPILSELTGDAKFKDLTVFEVDFDSQKDALRALGVRMQSTLIAYKGGEEVGRSTGETRKDAIAALLDKTI